MDTAQQGIIRARIDAAARNGGRFYLKGLGLQAVPEEVRAVPSLRVVDLRDNGLTDLPLDWPGLAKVEELDLSGNALAVVPKVLRGCKALRVLKLSDNLLTSLRLDQDFPGSLTTLDVDRNNIRVISGLGRPAKLRQLSANQNAVEAVTLADKAERSQLTSISLDDNRLADLPDGMQLLPRLYAMNLMRNRLVELPACIAQMKELAFLRVGGNQLERIGRDQGTFPPKLNALYLEDNRLATLPDGLGQLERLERLHLGGNPLTALPLLPVSLKVLWASRCELTACPELRPGMALEDLDLSENRLANAGKFYVPKKLKRLVVSGNQLTSLQLALASGSELQELWAQRNSLDEIQVEGMLTQLWTLDLSENRLKALPDFFSKSAELGRIYLADNRLTEIPPGVLTVATMEKLFLSQNQIRNVPASLTQMRWPNCLWLDHNPLEELPDALCNHPWVALILHETEFNHCTRPVVVQGIPLGKRDFYPIPLRPPTAGMWRGHLKVEVVSRPFRPYSWVVQISTPSLQCHINANEWSHFVVDQDGVTCHEYSGETAGLALDSLDNQAQTELEAFLQPYFLSALLLQCVEPPDHTGDI